LPPPANADYCFANFRSKPEASGDMLRYTRTFEVKQTSVPLNKIDDLKKL